MMLTSRPIFTAAFKNHANAIAKPHPRFFVRPSAALHLSPSNDISLHLLRSSFHTRPSPTPFSRPFRFPSASFSSSALAKGMRPYYGQSSNTRDSSPLQRFKTKLESYPNLHFYLIGLNVFVYLSWNYYESVAVRFRDSSGLRFMSKNFTVSMRNLKEGRLWTLVTSCFSHEGTGHLLMNCVGLYFIAPAVIGFVGNVGFLSLYLFSAGIVSLSFLGASTDSHTRYILVVILGRRSQRIRTGFQCIRTTESKLFKSWRYVVIGTELLSDD